LKQVFFFIILISSIHKFFIILISSIHIFHFAARWYLHFPFFLWSPFQ